MNPSFNISKLTKSILIATSSIMATGVGAASFQPLTAGFSPNHGGATKQETLNMNDMNSSAALIENNTPRANIYFSGPARSEKDFQSLLTNNTHLDGHYINVSKGGTSNITMTNGSSADFIEGGNEGATTNMNIVLDHSLLSGVESNKNYDDKAPDARVPTKDYIAGAAIYLDKKDNGTFNVVADNNSQIIGDIRASGTGAKEIKIDNSAMNNGTINLEGYAVNHVEILNHGLLKSAGSHDAMSLINAKENHVNINGANVAGNITLTSRGNSDLFIARSDVAGDIKVITAGNSNANVRLSGLEYNHDIDIVSDKGQASLAIVDGAYLNSNVHVEGAQSTVSVGKGSTFVGNVYASSTAGKHVLNIKNASHVGNTTSLTETNISDYGHETNSEVKNQTASIHNHSSLKTLRLANSSVKMDTSSQFMALGTAGTNSLIVDTLSADTGTGHYLLSKVAVTPGSSVKTTFANGAQNTSVRVGAYNENLSISQARSPDNLGAIGGQNTILTVEKGDVANDVKAAIAGLDGARQSATAVTNSIANRLYNLNASNIFQGVHEGASIWGDYLYQNATINGNVKADSVLQGTNIGADWTWTLNKRDTLTAGMAFGYVKNKLSNTDATGSFSNQLRGEFYSLYGNWQQGLQDNMWGFFTNANATYGEVNASASSTNVVGITTSNVKERLNSTSKGNVFNTEVRTGLNVKAMPDVIIQPYVLVGINKATSDGFENKYIQYSKNQSSAWYAGLGTRVMGSFDVKHVKLMPWADVSYTQEFNDGSDIKAGDYHLTGGKEHKVESVGVGVNAALSQNLGLNSGVYSSAGDVGNNLNLRLGMNYTF